MDIITCHVNADFDCLASMIGVQKLFPDGRLVFPGSQERVVREFLKTFPVDTLRIKDVMMQRVKRLIIVDTKSPERIGEFKSLLGRQGVQVFLYDHHRRGDGDIEATVETIEEVGATATLITELIRTRGIFITPLEATILCLGIYEETGSLRFLSTTERDLLSAAFLLKRGANLNIVSDYLRPQLSKDALLLLNELIGSMTEVFIHGIRVKLGTATLESYMGDAAQLAHNIMDMEDIDALVLILGMEGKSIMIGRSRVAELDIADLLRKFGGDGHPMAASAIVNELNPLLIKERVAALLPSIVKPTKTAKDIMTSPVVSINFTSTIKYAQRLLTKYAINVLPVLKNDIYAGLISRETVEKAIFHGFHDSAVYDFATTDELTAYTTTPIREIEEAMIEKNQRFMPVVAGHEIVGAITRTDLLRTLYEDYIRKERYPGTITEPKHAISRNVAAVLRERLPGFANNLLLIAGEIADRLNVKAYLVGGCVRDLLMAQRNLDLDIVIEGDGLAFAGELARYLHAKFKTHNRFQTAKISAIKHPDFERVNLPKDFTIDIATARTEYYESPAALPTVETSSIKKDLYRRDFTINALAISINERHFGVLIDFFGAQKDIKERIIRVLHNLSFVEDPTRAFRAVRLSERFGFKISKHMEKLIRSAISFNLFDKLSGTRLYDEFLLIFRETEPERALHRLSSYGLLAVLHRELTYTRQVASLLYAVRDTFSWYRLTFLPEEADKEADTGAVYFMALLSGISESAQTTTLDRLCAPPRTKEIIKKALGNYKAAMSVLGCGDPAVIYHALRGFNIEGVLFLMAACHVDKGKQRAISRYLTEHRNLKPAIDGMTLQQMGIKPGPVYSVILREVLDHKLRGNVNTADEEIAFVREKLRQ
ncbi:MAG: CBS domain-containing protein [Magnetococcales bacterium]|uniref:CBS domain-containing protein n=1 Tax=Candidatus Magnetobacterium casense TaxID=1455061 RepID=A0ABS6RZG2_9BACT|nr:CBS domain-containing protein [Candidatus Magnetobacterium casensis]MBF0607947.1 CBS domain-containing protein [Nitrospirota bacterium]MBV6342042.1 CBS domain-containing protein [Candidatus Magnetobacterium casensis]